MATRRRRAPAKKAAAKKTSNSKITEAQKAASEKRIERQDTLRGLGASQTAQQSKRGYSVLDGPSSKVKGANPTAPKPSPEKVISKGDPGYTIPLDRTKASKQPGDADAPSGLLAGLSLEAPVKQPSALTNPDLYGGGNKDRAAKIAQLMSAITETQTKNLRDKGNAVWMGAKPIKIRTAGPQRIDPETGKSTTTEQGGDDVYSKDQLMGWLADEAKVAQIKAAANKAGLDVETYDDVAKLWASVLDTASTAYSMNGQKVTPWAMIQLRGKFAGANGRPKERVTTTTNIDEMAPETARAMFESAAQQALGRSPTKAELDDFIAKAQTIAHDNPSVTRSVSQIGFDGNVESTVNTTTGGGVQDKAQMAALDAAKQSEDYASYQAAGNYFPMLFDALKSPV